MSEIKEPLLACLNDPDDVKPLLEIAGTKIDEVFIGCCMTNIDHFRVTAKLLETTGATVPPSLWLAPPVKIDSMAREIYMYLNFDKMDEYVVSAKRGQEIAVKLIA